MEAQNCDAQENLSSTQKCDSRENLVSTSMMLVTRPLSAENMASYYQDISSYSVQTPASTSNDAYQYEDHMIHCTGPGMPQCVTHKMGPFSYGTYQPYNYAATSYVPSTRHNCTCQIVPVQHTFLHQILMGKGYKNDRMSVESRPIIKQERLYGEHCCSYGYPLGYGYPMYH